MTRPKLNRKNRKYTPEEKASFHEAMEHTLSVSVAARALGLPIRVCRDWARKAGIDGKRAITARRETYLRLRSEGMHRIQAARQVGVTAKTGKYWDLGIRRTTNGLIYPDGRVIRYNSEMTRTQLAAEASLRAVEAVLDPRFLSLRERERIRDLRALGGSIRSVASMLGRAPSTISRELRENKTDTGGYEAYGAQRLSAGRRLRPRDSKLVTKLPLREFVQDKLRIHFSPEQICHALVKEHPTDAEMRVSPETIYQALYFQARGGLKKEVQAALRSGRTHRKTQKTEQERRPRFIDPMIMIADRPAEVADRAVPGHWEGDLITGTQNKTAIATLVERSTRYVMLVHLPGGHSAEEVRDGLIAAMATLPEHLRGSLTWDQGSEMGAHKQFTIATNMPVYFCDPASPWQRGSNENTNGLLRQYFPKGTDLSVYGAADLEHVAQELNGRPRKTLDWDTPAERLRDLLILT